MRTIFLDRDGVINENRADHVKSWEEFRFVPGSLAALRRLTQHNFRILVVTNQAIVNRGVVSSSTLEAIHRRMNGFARAHGASIAGIRYCPHRPDEHCGCRKPEPGMLLDLAREHGVNLRDSYFVGDSLTDVAAGQAAGCRTILTLTGRGGAELARAEIQAYQPSHVVKDLWSAVQLVLEQEHLIAPSPRSPAVAPVWA